MKRVLVVVGVAACSRHAPPVPAAELVANPLGDWRTGPAEANARSLWDLQVYEGRLYMGYGDAVVNTGPTDVIAFDPATGALAHEVTLPEEAIDTYRVLDDQLVVPGVDAMDPEDGNVYVRSAGEWHRHVIPHAVHVEDVALHGDELCAAVQDRTQGASVQCSRDGGATWDLRLASGFRATALFEVGSDLVVASPGALARVDEHGTTTLPLVLPGVPDLARVELGRATQCDDTVVLLAARATYTPYGASFEPLGAFALKNGPSASRIDVEGRPTDVFADDSVCYLLTSRTADSDHYIATIYALGGGGWQREAEASVDAAPRSAERLGPFFYIGLGCDGQPCTARAGQLVRVPVNRITSPGS